MPTTISGDTGVSQVQDGSIVTADLANGAVTQAKLADGALIEDSANGIGYGAGAGGTVTQLTSKSTAVTLNKPTGQITMHNAALGAGASVIFNVNNSLFGAADSVLLTPFANGNYRVEPASSNTGVFTVRVTNVTGGSLSEAVVINFAIIKGASA